MDYAPWPWLEHEQWADYLAYRKEIKKPMSERAERRALNMLEKAFGTAEERSERIDLAIANHWQGVVFPDDLKRAKQARPKPAVQEQRGATYQRRTCSGCGSDKSPIGKSGRCIHCIQGISHAIAQPS